MSLIPSPIHVIASADSAVLKLCRPVHISFAGDGAFQNAEYLAEYLRDSLQTESLTEPHDDGGELEGAGAIQLTVEPKLDVLAKLPNSQEGYCLMISEAGVSIRARAAPGLFYGVQSLMQLLPAAPGQQLELHHLQVIDSPRYPWRGVLIDVGRHFFSVEFLKKVLEIMAFYKFNRFHWHLTEDQGWRLELKSFPRLTEFGAWRGPPGSKYGGFYTQAQVREVIDFAAARFIEVVPEIEMPGHCCAALACYPHLSCTGRITEVPDFWGVQEDVYCAGKEEVFDFLETVLTEVCDLFPSDYIHIGGDECPKTRWSCCSLCQQRMRDEDLPDEFTLQSWFVGRINDFLRRKGKRLIGWDEILEGGLNPSTIVMSWRGITGGVRAAREGHQVIMTPTSHCYFDYRQSLRSDEPGAWFAMLPLEIVYDFDPMPPPPEHARLTHESRGESKGDPKCASPVSDMGGSSPSAQAMSEGGLEGDEERERSIEAAAAEQNDLLFSTSMPVAFQGRPEDDWTLDPRCASHIIGGQANVWTEYIDEEETVEYMLLPRLCAMSEALWSPQYDRNWPKFLERLKYQLPHLDARQFAYRPLA